MGLEEVASFVEAMERGSLTGAARVLGVPKSTVGRRIARLEEELGQVLVRRTARTFQATEAGEALYQRSVPALRELREAMLGARDHTGEVSGTLRLTLPVDLGSSPSMLRLLVGFRREHPGVRLFIDLTDRFVDIVEEGFDFAFRIHPGGLADRSSVKVRRVATLSAALYASRAYLERAGEVNAPEELENHDTITFDRGPLRERWPLRQGAEGVVREYAIRPALVTTGPALIGCAVEEGAGVGLLVGLVSGRLVTEGRVVRVLPAWEMPSVPLSLLWPASRVESPRVRAFLAFLAQEGACPGEGD